MAVARRGAIALTLTVGVLSGCGGSDGIDNARYVRDADKICKDARVAARAGAQPLSMDELATRLKASHEALLGGARELRALGKQLADEPSSEVRVFQRRVMPVVSMTMTLADDAEFGDRNAVRKHAERLRKRSGALYRAARAAGLDECGRGGNRAADGALFVAYRGAYLDARDVVALQTALTIKEASGVGSPAEFVRVLDGYLEGLRSFRDDLAQLAPPTDLRRPHRTLKRRIAKLLSGGNAVRAGFLALPSGRAGLLALLHEVQADESRADRAESRLRKLLTPKRARTGPKRSGDTV